MAETVQTLVTEILDEGGFDATEAQALKWLDRRHKWMVAHAKAYKDTLQIGTTVVAQQAYPLPSSSVFLELNGLQIENNEYRHVDRAALLDGAEFNGYAFAADWDDGVAELLIYPTPETAGLAILAFGAFMPPTLVTGTVNGVPITPLWVDDDLVDALVDGAMATALGRAVGDERGDLAQVHEQRFQEGAEKFRRRVARRLRGGGPAQVRVYGINA